MTARLAAGDPFMDIAEEAGMPDGGRWDTFQMGEGGVTDIEVPEAMKTALEGLDEGDTSKPFQVGSRTAWLHVLEVNRPPARSIFDPGVQLELRNEILGRRGSIEWNRYLSSLMQEGITDDLDAMAMRIYRIALVRYAKR